MTIQMLMALPVKQHLQFMARMRSAHIGMLGAGKIGRRHLHSYERIPQVMLSVYDSDEIALAAVQAPFAKKCRSEDDLFASEGLEAVDVCTPTLNHEGHVLRALRAGLHVLCEKPLTSSITSALRLAEAAREARRVLMVGYIFRFSPHCRLVKQLLENGVIGRPYLAFLRVGGPGSHAEWKHARFDGGARLEKLVHLLDLAAWFFGPPDSVTPLVQAMMFPHRTINGRVIETTAEDFVLVKWSGKELGAYLQADLVSSVYAHSIEIQGSNGSVLASVVADSPVVLSCVKGTGRYHAGRTVIPVEPADFHYDQLRHFLALIGGEVLSGHHNQEDSLVLHHALSLLNNS